MRANTAKDFAISGLTAATNYDAYIVAEDANPNLSTATQAQFTSAAASGGSAAATVQPKSGIYAGTFTGASGWLAFTNSGNDRTTENNNIMMLGLVGKPGGTWGFALGNGTATKATLTGEFYGVKVGSNGATSVDVATTCNVGFDAAANATSNAITLSVTSFSAATKLTTSAAVATAKKYCIGALNSYFGFGIGASETTGLGKTTTLQYFY